MGISVIKVGDVLIMQNGMLFKITGMHGRWVKCDFLSKDGEWKPRGYCENRKDLEAKISAGKIKLY